MVVYYLFNRRTIKIKLIKKYIMETMLHHAKLCHVYEGPGLKSNDYGESAHLFNLT